MNIEETFYLGYTSKLHGKNGELVIKLDVDRPEAYRKLESVFVRIHKSDNQLVPFFITKTSLQNNQTLVIKIEGVDSAEQASELVAKEVYLPLTMLPPLTGDKFYFHEVIGFDVEDEIHGRIGKIKQVLEYPHQAVMEVVSDEGKEILIPIHDNFILEVNREIKLIKTNTPEGLIDVYIGG